MHISVDFGVQNGSVWLHGCPCIFLTFAYGYHYIRMDRMVCEFVIIDKGFLAGMFGFY